MWLEKSLKDFGENPKHYDYRTNGNRRKTISIIKMKLQDIIDEIFEETTNEDLRNWFKSKWVNIGKKDKSGKHPPCGTSGKKKGYAKCVPAAKNYE